ncbi:hypothetical protein ACFYXC_37415 [Streptomyces sp. NPDC002701]
MESTLTSSSPTCPRAAASTIRPSLNAWNTPAFDQALTREYTLDEGP